ncbi:MAG: isocitrate lyase/phosphoenolpyruvate mutase family protein [Rudaea sp.]
MSADFENGYAHDLDGLKDNVRCCVETGVAGLSIEDAKASRRSRSTVSTRPSLACAVTAKWTSCSKAASRRVEPPARGGCDGVRICFRSMAPFRGDRMLGASLTGQRHAEPHRSPVHPCCPPRCASI